MLLFQSLYSPIAISTASLVAFTQLKCGRDVPDGGTAVLLEPSVIP
jgi:hypothetical protein